MAFFFQFVNVILTLIDLQILKNPCVPGIKPIWSWYMIFLMCCWILIARILLRIFASIFISQSRFDEPYWMLGAGALGRPRGMVRGGRREEGSGWGTRVYLWRIHVDIWLNQSNIVKLKNKIKLRIFINSNFHYNV